MWSEENYFLFPPRVLQSCSVCTTQQVSSLFQQQKCPCLIWGPPSTWTLGIILCQGLYPASSLFLPIFQFFSSLLPLNICNWKENNCININTKQLHHTAYSVPGTVLTALYILTHLIFTSTLLGSICLYFKDEETEASSSSSSFGVQDRI